MWRWDNARSSVWSKTQLSFRFLPLPESSYWLAPFMLPNWLPQFQASYEKQITIQHQKNESLFTNISSKKGRNSFSRSLFSELTSLYLSLEEGAHIPWNALTEPIIGKEHSDHSARLRPSWSTHWSWELGPHLLWSTSLWFYAKLGSIKRTSLPW